MFLLLILSSPGFSQDLTIMTYNIRYDNPGDSINAWKFRKDKLCNLVRQKDPDLLGVQEALENQVKDIDSLLPGYGHVGVGRDDGKTKGEYSAIFYKKSTFNFLENGTFWLSQTPEVPGSMGWDAACTRIVTWIKLENKYSGAITYHFNTHFDHMGKLARKKSALLLMKKIKEIASENPVIVTGDFNCTLSSKPMRMLTKGKLELKDSRSSAPVIKGPDYSYSTFYVNGKHEEVIDHILTNDFFVTKSYQIADDNHEGRYFSDHLPVIVKISQIIFLHTDYN